MAEYTPGSWEARPNKYVEGQWIVSVGMPSNRVIAYFGDRDQLDDIDIANARLIAAAPDLLSNLQFAVKLLEALPGFRGTAQVDRMVAAIAKATGEKDHG